MFSQSILQYSNTAWLLLNYGFPGGSNGKASAIRPRFNPRVGKIPWRREWLTHSSIFASKIPWTEEHGRLQTSIVMYNIVNNNQEVTQPGCYYTIINYKKTYHHHHAKLCTAMDTCLMFFIFKVLLKILVLLNKSFIVLSGCTSQFTFDSKFI